MLLENNFIKIFTETVHDNYSQLKIICNDNYNKKILLLIK